MMWAREITIPMIKTPFPIHSVTWNKDGKTFAYTEEKNIIVRNSEDLSITQTVTTNHGIIEFMEFTQTTAGSGIDQLAALTQNNMLDIRILPETEPINSIKGLTNSLPTALAYNYNGNYIATASADGHVYLYMQNYLTSTLIERPIKTITSPARTLCFSRDNNMLAIGSIDDQIYLVNIANGDLIKSYPYKSSLNIPVRFTLDSKNIVFAKNSSTISVLNLKTNKVRNFQTLRDIQSIEISADGKYLIILADDNQIYFYDLKSGELEQYVPAFNTSPITCYAFNNIDSKLAVGHKDGSLYILNLDDVILLPNERPDSLKYNIPMPSEQNQDQQDPNEKDKKEEKAQKPQESIPLEPFKKRDESKKDREVKQYLADHGIIIEGGITFPPQPFSLEITLDLGYENFNLLSPFYFGGMITPFLALPSENFPFKYKEKGTLLSSPYFTGAKIYMPMGFIFYPFEDEIFAYAELDFGMTLNVIWNGQLGEKIVTSDPFSAFYTAAKVGLGWRFLHLTVSGNYDALMGFSYSFGIGGRIYLRNGGGKNDD